MILISKYWNEEKRCSTVITWKTTCGHCGPQRPPSDYCNLYATHSVLVEGTEHILNIIRCLLVVSNAEEALELVHIECSTWALHHKLLIPVLQLCNINFLVWITDLAQSLTHHGNRSQILWWASLVEEVVAHVWLDSLVEEVVSHVWLGSLVEEVVSHGWKLCQSGV